MSDHLHPSASSSSSPGRTPIISRPTWPWQVSSLRNSASTPSGSSLDNRNSLSSSPRSTSAGPQSSSTSIVWQPVASSRASTNSKSTMGLNVHRGNIQEDSTRQWSFMCFEWVIRDVHKLRDFVEGLDKPDIENVDFDILKQSPMLGDNKFKLEITFTHSDGPSDSNIKPTLSLYITSLMVDFAHADYELSTSMMTAIKCQTDRVGERGAPPEWVWDFWQLDWVFRQEHEVWECPLPPLSALLENVKIRETDSFVICVQIHSPSGPCYPQQPAVHSVPKDLLDGLEASLDNSHTGDIRFICLEKQNHNTAPDATPPTGQRSSSSASYYSPFSSRTTVRKRVIYAHSDILIRRSEYFATMLASSFSENPAHQHGERKIYTIVIEEADFETIYWLLKFCYTNYLIFKEEDDPRVAIDGVGAGWSAKWLQSRGGEWDWKTIQKEDSATNDTRSVTSGDSLLSIADAGRSSSHLETLPHAHGISTKAASTSSSPTGTRNPSSPKTMTSTSSRPLASASSPRRGTPSSAAPTGSNIPTISRSKPVPIPLTTNTFTSTRPGYPVSPHAGRQHPLTPVSVPDPHPHPTPSPRPASALSIYQVAHRYAMPSLATLALEHMMSTITPQSSFALLLASSIWEELHSLVEDYVVEKWDEVSISEEFEQCCQEVAAGEWGQEGGKTLMSIFRRLRSPNALN